MSGRFDRFTDSALAVMALAKAEARSLGHDYVGTEHLLVALVDEGNNCAARLLIRGGADAAKLRSVVERLTTRGEHAQGIDVELTPRTKKIIELAVDEARRRGHASIDPEHLLLGLVREGQGVAIRALNQVGVQIDDVRARLQAILGDSAENMKGGAADTSIGTAGRPARAPQLDSGRRPPMPPPKLVQQPARPRLVNVFPIVQTRELGGGIEVVLISLDAYDDRAVLRGTVTWPAPPFAPDRYQEMLHPDLILTVVDDRGHRYKGGGLHQGTSTWGHLEFEKLVTPALDPAARWLRLQVVEIQWRKWGTAPHSDQAPRDIGTDPWTFDIPLRAD